MWAFAGAALLCCLCVVDSAPLDNFPLNSQLPPVARISQPFSFVFSPLTFSSPFPMVYSLIDPPEWLSIDSDSRRLFGLPSDNTVPPGQVVGVSIQLQADDGLGSTTANATLVVARNPPPSVRVAVADQIKNFGPVSGASSLHLQPSKPFSFSFDPDTFDSSGGSGLSYYAVTRDNAPLPSWLKFEASNISFWGNSPPVESLVQPPQSFDIQLVASDILGFASVSVPLSIVVGIHELATDSPIITLNTTRGEAFEYGNLADTIKLDGNPLNPEDITSISTSGLPSWLRFDAVTWSLAGTPGPASKSVNASLAIQDKFTDRLNITLAIHVARPVFRSNFTGLNLTGGERITADLKPYLWEPDDVDADLEDTTRVPWLRLDNSDLSLSGEVPFDASAFDTTIAIRATSESTGRTEKQNLVIRVEPAPSSTSSPTASPTNASAVGPGGAGSSVKSKILAVLIPLLVLALGLAVILFLYLRRRKRESEDGAGMLAVSAPIPGSFVRHDTGFDNAVTHAIFDIGPLPTDGIAPKSGQAVSTSTSIVSGASSDLQQHRVTGPAPSEPGDGGPSRSSATQRTRNSRPASRGASRGPHTESDNRSLLSDTSLGEGDGHISASPPELVANRPQDESFKSTLGLNVPMIPEPFSIQSTPAIAYGPSNSHFSDDETVTERRNSPGALRRHSSRRLRAMSRRVSNAWKQGSASRLFDEYNRKSYQSSTSGYTTRTSILTTGIAAEKPATASFISRPTVVHIPSRPDGVRRFSRRVGGSSPLFGGGSVVRSPRNLDVIAQSSPASSVGGFPRAPSTVRAFTSTSRESDTSWDRLARDSLGIAHKEIAKVHQPSLQLGFKPGRHQVEFPSAEGGQVWHDRQSKDLMSPRQWPRPSTAGSKKRGSASFTQLSATPPKPEPIAPRSSRDRMPARTPSPDSAWSSSYSPTPPGKKRLQHSPVGRKIHISRARPYCHDAKSRLPKAPSPHEWPRPAPAPPRPLPQTPPRPPLGERTNESRGQGKPRDISKKSGKMDTRAPSDAEDGWEDVRPDDSSSGDLYVSSSGSYPVLI